MIPTELRTNKKQNQQPKPENQEIPPSPEPNQIRLRKQEHETDQMKKLFATFTKNIQKQLREQKEKNAMETASMKRAKMDTKIC
jgi:hypothetical protein